ncbi:prominin-like protein [Drosophila innubila]|uniref:prominin-like protein n=1 Tax=Drosophila innubila TaxID=198719 RepID=UPI00148CDA9B|nr:prominin-like protein [Drosophila innubila]
MTNLTHYTQAQVSDYIDMVITESYTNVGLCEPLSYIYYRSVNFICGRLVDPINGFWLGLILCALLFLPVLYLAHHLMCLFKKYASYTRRADIVETGRPSGCPACTGLPYVPSPVVICSGGQQKIGGCTSDHTPRTGGGVARNDVLTFVDDPSTETFTEEQDETSFSKRKQD